MMEIAGNSITRSRGGAEVAVKGFLDVKAVQWFKRNCEMAHRTKYRKFSAFSAHSATPREQFFSARSVARAAVLCVWLVLPAAGAQTPEAMRVFTAPFPPEEFAARRTRLMERIGDAVAVIQGAAEKPAEAEFRQNNQFHYLTGVDVPRAILVIDGRARRSTLYLPATNRARAFGPLLAPGAEAERETGIEAVVVRDSFAVDLVQLGNEGRRIFTSHRPEVLGNGSAGDAAAFARATKEDPWDGRPSREDAFIARLRTTVPRMSIENLDPLLDSLRAIKSRREIELIREATRVTGLGIMEAMRDATPGMYEYELDAAARYVFRKHGAQGEAYFALVATGANMPYSHYHKGTSRLRDGDLVQFDYAPDFRYYVSDVTRVFPANGKFTARQRELYEIYLRLYQALLSSIRPRAAPRDIIRDAVVKMDAVMTTYPFTDAAIRDAATAFVQRYRNSRANSLGHTIGMEVHDVRLASDVLLPGHIFTIEPAMNLMGERVGLRLEDVILITETGYENLSAFVPVEIADIERLMAQPGLSAALLRLPNERR
jgi:Xaa-Pro aminopeptidase